MRKYVLFILVLSFTFIMPGEKIVPMPELHNPATIIVDQGQILVAEFPHIFVYSLDDFKFIIKFGQKGEGPEEFFQYTRIQVDPKQPQYIVINSHMKMSYFTNIEMSYTKKKISTLQEVRCWLIRKF